MDRYFNLNAKSFPPLNNESTSPNIFSRIMYAGSNINNTTLIIIGIILLFTIISIFYYFYYVNKDLKKKHYPNNENIPIEEQSSNNAELLFFYANWCPHCKAAKPIWNELKSEYENKTINGYKIIFTEIDCSEESAEVEKLINQYSVEGYPTIKLLKDGQIIDYDAKPSKETLTKFLNTVL
jgi:thiol-disulfide isomerase/thioredoxin